MRLREVREVLRTYDENIKYKVEKNGSNYTVHGLEKSFNTINALSVLGFLDEDIERLKTLDSVYHSRTINDSIVLKPETFEKVKSYISIIKEKINGYQKLISNSIPEPQENVISVKLPQYEDLDDLTEFFGKLNKALRLGLKNNEINGSYSLKNFDTGSLWIDLAIATGVINFLGQIIEKAQNIQMKSTESQIMKVNLKKLEIEQNVMVKMETALDKQIDAVVDAEIGNLTTKGDINDPDAINDIKHSIRMFSELIHQGAQFHPPLNAPEEVVNSFPEVPKPYSLESPQTLLESLSIDSNITETE
ncbi:hypothetical protein [Peribacillus simplex]|uniref:hypothetical protein n=1 Tax=Peribacillus simplex TaxID=1478 RepID=UPI0011DD5FDA|nr:hypothetical protein [Peribacillus simplex]